MRNRDKVKASSVVRTALRPALEGGSGLGLASGLGREAFLEGMESVPEEPGSRQAWLPDFFFKGSLGVISGVSVGKAARI